MSHFQPYFLVLLSPLLFSASCSPTPTPSPTVMRPVIVAAPTGSPATPTSITVIRAPTVAPSAAPHTPTQAAPAPVLITEVVDGDTVKVQIGGRSETVRIIGLDTPEVVDPREPVQCYGREASAKAKELLSGQSVRLVADPTQGERDTYQRLLRYVDRADGLDFGLTMIREGFAHEFTFRTPYQRQASYKAAQTEARQQNRGFWSPTTCDGDTTKPADVVPKPVATAAPTKPAASTSTPAPSAVGHGVPPLNKDDCPPGHPIKGNQGSRSIDTWIYHMPGVQSYSVTDPEQCFATEADAQAAGFRKALR